MNFIPHWKDGLSNEQYHANRAFFSSSQIKVALTESLEAFRHHTTVEKPKPQTEALKVGTIIHSAVLEGESFLKNYVVKPDFSAFGHANSNAHKAAKIEWIEANKDKIIVTQDELDMTKGIAESILKHPDASSLLRNNLFERSGYYWDPVTNIPLRIRYDAYDPSSKILLDIKSTTSAKYRDFSYSIMKYRYDLSLAMYGEGIKEIDGLGPENFVFIPIEKTAPYHVAVYELSGRALEIGRSDYRHALDRIAECQRAGYWPPMQTEMEEIDLPKYFEGVSHVR